MRKAGRLSCTILAALASLAFAVWACGGSGPATNSGPECGSDPGSCPSGTTCWPETTSGLLECLPSDSAGTLGVGCLQDIGYATCATGLACDQTGPDAGRCTYYCGSTGKTCPAGFSCNVTQVGSGPTIELCRGVDAGDGGSQPLPEAGSDASIPPPTGSSSGTGGNPTQR